MDTARLLLDLEQIKMLKHRYFRCVDTGGLGRRRGMLRARGHVVPQQACASRGRDHPLPQHEHGPGPGEHASGAPPRRSSSTATRPPVGGYLHDKVMVEVFDFALEAPRSTPIATCAATTAG